jgi:HEAT repeat protein
VRQSAIEALGRIGDASAIPLLAATLKSESLRAVSVGALSRIPTDESVDVLADVIVDQSAIMAGPPSWALAACKHPRSTQALLAALYKKRVGHLSFIMADEGRDLIFDGAEEEYQRFSCGMCVMRVWSFRSIDRLLAALEDERDSVRGSAAYAIALAPVRDPRTLNVLVPLLEDESVAASAAFALGSFGDVRAVEPLIAALDSDDVTLRRFATHGLGDLGDSRAVAPLMKLLDDTDIRFAAVEALTTMKAQEAAPRLAAMLKEVRDPAPEPNLGPKEIVGTIISVDSGIARETGEYLTPDPEPVPTPPIRESRPRELSRRNLLDALGWIASPDVTPTLLEIARDRTDPWREEALRLFSEMGHGADPDVLFEFTSDEDEEIRREAAVALGKAGDKRAAGLLLPLLENEHWDTRAMEAVGYTRDRSAVAPLLAVLSERDSGGMGTASERRRAAIDALGRIGDCSATEPLLRHLERARAAPQGTGSLNGDVTSVERALVAIGDERAVEPLLAPWKQGKTMLDLEFVTVFPGTKMLDAIAAVMLDLEYDAKIREGAASRFEQAQRPETLPALRKALHDPDADVRGSACWAIWGIRPPTDDEVEAMLLDPELAHLVGAEILDRLTQRGRFPRDADEAVRFLILAGARYDLIALWPRTERLLLADLHSQSPDRQLYAARCLIRIGYGKETIPELVAAMGKSDDERMAHDFVNSDNEQLRRAVMAWSERTGKSLDSQRPAVLGWGAMGEQ